MLNWTRSGLSIVLAGMILVACASESNNSGQNRATEERPATTIATINVPALGEDPAPPVPLELDDERYPVDRPVGDALERAQRLYNQHCAECHGQNGEGEQPDPMAAGKAPPHNNTGHTWHHPDQQNFATVWQGGVKMPAFHEKLTPDEILLVLGYLKTWWDEEAFMDQRSLTQAFIENEPEG